MSPQPPSLSSKTKPVIPFLLAGCAVFLLLLWLVRWWWTSPIPPVRFPTPVTCNHWVAIHGAVQSPQVLCWKPNPGTVKPHQISLWRNHILRAKPLCPLPASLPLPAPGQQLSLVSPTDRRSPCGVTISWMPGTTRIALGIPLRLNHDTLEDLSTIPVLSRRLAQRIIHHRHTRGPFRSLEQLRQIKGIGPKTLTKLRPYLSLSTSVPPSHRP